MSIIKKFFFLLDKIIDKVQFCITDKRKIEPLVTDEKQ